MPRLTVKQVSEKLNICGQRVRHKISVGHFPNAKLCECGNALLIPEDDLNLPINRRKDNEKIDIKPINNKRPRGRTKARGT